MILAVVGTKVKMNTLSDPTVMGTDVQTRNRLLDPSRGNGTAVSGMVVVKDVGGHLAAQPAVRCEMAGITS